MYTILVEVFKLNRCEKECSSHTFMSYTDP